MSGFKNMTTTNGSSDVRNLHGSIATRMQAGWPVSA